jgi:4-amino-4-deoxy-L-arabinose transferase-like glycosyltransferase
MNEIRQQIASLQGELAQLEARQRDIKRRKALQASIFPFAPVNVQAKLKSSVPSIDAKLLLASLAFILGGLGQYLLHVPLKIGGWGINGWILYGAAAVLFLLAFRRIRAGQFALGLLADTPTDSSPSSRIFWVWIAFAVLAMAGSIVLFGKPATLPSAWNLHLVSVILFATAFIPLDKLRYFSLPPRTQLKTQLVRLLPILVVFALATFARLWQLGTFPFGDWYDEAENGLAAAQILHDPSFRPVFFDYTEMPAHFNYLIAASFSVFGVNPLALRLVTAAFGISAVVFAYLLFRRWFGEGLGIVAACLLAVMRYHLTFSRFGMQGIATPAFELAALYFFDRALADKKISDFAWLGLTVGFGLAFYHAFRLFPVVLAVFLTGLLVAAFIKYGAQESIKRYIRGLSIHWVIAALALLIAIAPVAQFAVRNSEVFAHRMGMTSILARRDEPDVAKAYWNNLSKHLLMFNVQGDRNGRHNLPGAAMLDPVMGVLFILGIVYAVWHWRNPPNLLMLLLFIIMLHAGILSLDFEAPQSLRSIGIIPALIYFITLPIAAVTRVVNTSLDKGIKPASWKLSALSNDQVWNMSLFAVLAVIGYLNLNMFFNKQQNDPSAWAQYSTGETIVANEMNRLAATDDLIVSGAYDKYPTVLFLAGNVTNVRRWTVTDRLPIVHSDDGRGVAMFFDEKLMSAYNDAQRLYPHASFIEHHAPAGGGTVMWEVILTPDDLRSVQGVTAQYYQGSSVEGKPAKEETLTQASLDWTKAQPLSEPFIAELHSTLYATEYGSYHFSVRGAPDARLWIDENTATDAPITLARGNHALRLQIPGSQNQFELLWQPPDASQLQLVPASNLFRPPVTNSGLLGAYYPSPDWSGAPAFTQIDPEIAYYFHIIPLPRPYTVEWTGKLFAPATGTYQFALDSVDGSQLTLDDRVVVDNPSGHTTVEGTTTLAQGWHDIVVHFSDRTGGTQIYLYWTPPSAKERELVPTRYLSPPMGQFPATPEDLAPTQP